MRQALLLAAAGIAAGVMPASPARGASCESLAALQLPDTKITLAAPVAQGAFNPPPGGPPMPGPPAAYADLPAFCRVAATLDADERLGHQDRGLAAGRGLERQVPGGRQRRLGRRRSATRRWPTALQRGYATASTDTGHDGGRGAASRSAIPRSSIDFALSRRARDDRRAPRRSSTAFYGARAEALVLERLLDRRHGRG